MSQKIIYVRQRLHQKLIDLQTPGDWSHIIEQTGMFNYLGLSPAQVASLQGKTWRIDTYLLCRADWLAIEKYHIYMLHTGRMSMAGLNDNNLGYFAQAIDCVVREIRS